jgi:hypothetical protein
MAKKTASRSTALAIKHALARRPTTMVKPIVIKPTPVVVKKSKSRKSGRRGGAMGGLLSHDRVATVIGALAVGFLEKQNIMASLPALPIVGRKGTIAVAAYFLSDGGKNKLADDICTAALVLAAHEFGSTGSVSGGEYVAGGTVDYVAGF